MQKNEKYSLDKTDLEIVNFLKKNSQTPLKEMAKQIKIRPSTVFNRIRKLRSEGVILGYTVILNQEAVKLDFVGFVLVSTQKDLPESFFADKNLKEAFGVTGEYDLLLKYRFPNVLEFNKSLLNFRKYPGIKKTLSMVSTISLKEEL